MTLTMLYQILASSGYPVAYNHFNNNDNVTAPYIIYSVAGSRNFIADHHVYEVILEVDIKLYTYKKDVEAEMEVERILSAYPWNKKEFYYSDTELYEVTYEIEEVFKYE